MDWNLIDIKFCLTEVQDYSWSSVHFETIQFIVIDYVNAKKITYSVLIKRLRSGLVKIISLP